MNLSQNKPLKVVPEALESLQLQKKAQELKEKLQNLNLNKTKLCKKVFPKNPTKIKKQLNQNLLQKSLLLSQIKKLILKNLHQKEVDQLEKNNKTTTRKKNLQSLNLKNKCRLKRNLHYKKNHHKRNLLKDINKKVCQNNLIMKLNQMHLPNLLQNRREQLQKN